MKVQVYILSIFLLAIYKSCFAVQLKNQNEIKQDTNRIDLRIPLDQSSLIPQSNLEESSHQDQPLIYIQVEISFQKNLDHNDIFEQDDLYFCLSDYLGSQCINSVNLDIYQQNFRSGMLFISKEIPINVFEQFVTVIVSDRLMKQEGNKIIYTVRWQTWLGKPKDEELRCPFDCNMRGNCIKGVCYCNQDTIGRSCEFKLQAANRQPWRASMDIQGIMWVQIESPTDIVLLDFLQGFIQIVAFSDQRSFQISSQYLLNKPQKIILDKKFIMRQGISNENNESPNSPPFLSNQQEDQAYKDNQPLLLCIFSYQDDTHFLIYINENKIKEIIDEYDKEYIQNDPESEFLSMIITVLVILVIIAGIVLIYVYDKYKIEKKNASILQLYTSKKFSELEGEYQQEDTCRICLEKYLSDTVVRLHYKCKKVFHKQCFDKWALTGNNRKCPQCRDDYEPILIEVLHKMNQTTTELTSMHNREGVDNEGETLAVDRSQIFLNTPFVNHSDITHDESNSGQQVSQYLAPNQAYQIQQNEQSSTSETNNNTQQLEQRSQQQNKQIRQVFDLVSNQNRDEELSSDEDQEEGEDDEQEDEDEEDEVDEDEEISQQNNLQQYEYKEQENEDSEDEELEEVGKETDHKKNNNKLINKEKADEEEENEELDSIEEQFNQINEQLNVPKNNQLQQKQKIIKKNNKSSANEYIQVDNQEKDNNDNIN